MLRLAAILLFLAAPALAQPPLQFPVTGEWFALAGPPCAACAPNLAHRLSLVPIDPFGRLAPSCANQPVLAPSGGTILAVATGAAYGHHIAIARSDDLTIVLGFLRDGSVTATPGDTIIAGADVARCDGPALHIHLQAGRDILAPEAEGLPMSFSNLDVRTPGGCVATSLLFGGQGTCAAP